MSVLVNVVIVALVIALLAVVGASDIHAVRRSRKWMELPNPPNVTR